MPSTATTANTDTSDTSTTPDIKITKSDQSRIKEVDLDNPGFGQIFSDHMLSIKYEDGEWQTPEIVPYGAFEITPAMCSLHYGQAIFEGLKAFKNKDGSIKIFRPQQHHNRFNKSCRRLCIPEIDKDVFMEGLRELIDLDQEWVPDKPGNALYIRPFVFATDEYLSVQASSTYQFFIITSPVGAYYEEGIDPVSLITSDKYARSVPGGVGHVKTPGNYAASLLPAKKAKQKGFTQVLWLDANERRYIEEVGTMNIFFLIDDVLVTPPLKGAILDGITRRSVIQLAKEWGITVNERPITIDEVIEKSEAGHLREVFGTGTAAVISPVGKIQHKWKSITINNYEIGSFAQKLYDTITGIQNGSRKDPFDWMETAVSS